MRHSIHLISSSLFALLALVLVLVQGFVINMGDDGWSAVATKRSGGAPIAEHEHQKPRKGAIYITVGPQCGGKTTAVSKVLAKDKGVDITIDDQALVYIKVPTGRCNEISQLIILRVWWTFFKLLSNSLTLKCRNPQLSQTTFSETRRATTEASQWKHIRL